MLDNTGLINNICNFISNILQYSEYLKKHNRKNFWLCNVISIAKLLLEKQICICSKWTSRA